MNISQEIISNNKTLINLSHLNYLCEKVNLGNTICRIVHIYADTPSYRWTDAPGEGIACVDDTARAAVVYLRHFELTGNRKSLRIAEDLLRFVIYMQREDGLFYNFVLNNRLDINMTHPNSIPDPFSWWSARGVWALGTGVRILKKCSPDLAGNCVAAIRKTLPRLNEILSRYPQKENYHNRLIPLWLVNNGSDATSELLLGLIELNKSECDNELEDVIKRFAEGIACMQYGSINTFPYGLHASCKEWWHGWGNSQTQALAMINTKNSAIFEAENFYPRLLVDGWCSYIPLDKNTGITRFPQIAYTVRCVCLGLIRLYEATGETCYITMAGLTASWFFGNNVSGKPIYDIEKGYGYDGIDEDNKINLSSGAESTIETLYSILELEQYQEGLKWIDSKSESPVQIEIEGIKYHYRIYNKTDNTGTKQSIAVVLNLTEERFQLIEGEELLKFINKNI